MPQFLEAISILALGAGAGMGFLALINPQFAARLVRLQPDPERAGGQAEFRATYGGFFLGVHLLALGAACFAFRDSFEGPQEPPVTALVAVVLSLPAVLGWLLSAIGRVIAIFADKVGTRFNWISAGVELALALCILAPMILSLRA